MNRSDLMRHLAGLLLLGFSAMALARSPIDHLTATLQLDEQQAATIGVLFEAHLEFMQNQIQWRTDSGTPNPAALSQIQAAREALHEEILDLLDSDQAATFLEMDEHRSQQRKARLERLIETLDLSQEQRDAIRVLMAESRVARMGQRESFQNDLQSILSPEQLAEFEQAMHSRDHRGHRKGHRGR